MAKVSKVCVTDVGGNTLCPHCATPMRTVDYYTAKPVQQQSVQRDMNTQTIVTTYTDVYRRIGGICLACANKNQKKKRMVGLVLLIVGGAGGFASMLAGLILSNIAETRGENIGTAMNTPMAFMIVCVILAVIGLSVFVGSRAFGPGRITQPDALFVLFLKHMIKEGHHPGLAYLTPEQAAKLNKIQTI